MAERKALEELTLMDDYMFAQVMRDPALLKPLLEYILKTKIAVIRPAEPQKSMAGSYDYHGVRLDLYVEDENGVVYDVEAQTAKKENLPKRMRFYQSTVDLYKLERGVDYARLEKSYIIFICSYDPFDRNRSIYRFSNICEDEPDLCLGDETVKVIANINGTKDELSSELKELFSYLRDGSVTGDYSRELDKAVKTIKTSEEGRTRYKLYPLSRTF